MLATLLWGSTFSFTKVLVAHVPPMYMLGYRFFLTVLVVFFLFRGVIVAEFSRGVRSRLLLAFSLVNVCAIGLQTYGIQFTTASNAGFISAFAVVLVPVLKRCHFRTAIPRHIYMAVFLALVGLYGVSFGPAIPESLNRGDVFLFLCAICYGYYIVILERAVKQFSGATILFVSFGLTAVACLVLGVCVETHPAVAVLWSLPVAANLLALVAFGTVIAYLLMAWGQKHVSAEVAALIYAAQPLFAFLIAWTFLRESLSPWQMAGGGIVILALILGLRFPSKECRSGPERLPGK